MATNPTPSLGPCVPCFERKGVKVPATHAIGGWLACDECFGGDGMTPEEREEHDYSSTAIYKALRNLISGKAKQVLVPADGTPKKTRVAVYNCANRLRINVTASTTKKPGFVIVKLAKGKK